MTSFDRLGVLHEHRPPATVTVTVCGAAIMPSPWQRGHSTRPSPGGGEPDGSGAAPSDAVVDGFVGELSDVGMSRFLCRYAFCLHAVEQ